MGVFGHFKKSKPELSDEEIRLNRMWALWAEGHADSSWRELMTYQGEVNKDGHDQYFLNTGNTGNLQKKMAILETVFPAKQFAKSICRISGSIRKRARWEDTDDIGTMRRSV